MAFPTILVDSTNGAASDTLCSGAGPTTALTGTAAASDGAGTTITLDSGTVLTSVDTTGLHALYFADTTAGHRRFSTIIGTAGSGGATPTVTLREAVTISLSGKSWAIGGVRATVWGTVSLLLFDNNSAAGDAMPGWTVEMQSGHSESIGAAKNIRRAGDTTSGRISLRGNTSAATLPLFTFTTDADGIIIRVAFIHVSGFEMQNSAATRNVSRAFVMTTAPSDGVLFERLKISHSTNKWWKGIIGGDGIGGYQALSCNIGFCANVGISTGGAGSNMASIRIINNFVHDCGSGGISFGNSPYFSCSVMGNIVYNNTGIGFSYDNSRSDDLGGCIVNNNTFDSNTTDGVKIVTAATSLVGFQLMNNIASNNGGYGFNFSSATFTTQYIIGLCQMIRNNDTYNNTSGAYNTGGSGAFTNTTATFAPGDPGLNPTYTNAAGGDFSIGGSLASQGYPIGGTLAVGGGSTYSYVDPGAAQRPIAPQSLILQSIGTW